MADKKELLGWIQHVTPVLEASLDPVAVVDESNSLYYANTAMKTLLQLRPSDLKNHKKFCDCISLSICLEGCRIEELLEDSKVFRFDESPAMLPSKNDSKAEPAKLRVSIRAVPLPASAGGSGRPVGAVITLRDTTADILVHAKYHKLTQMLAEREEDVEHLMKLNRILRRKI